jgi:hypothetical protein
MEKENKKTSVGNKKVIGNFGKERSNREKSLDNRIRE